MRALNTRCNEDRVRCGMLACGWEKALCIALGPSPQSQHEPPRGSDSIGRALVLCLSNLDIDLLGDLDVLHPKAFNAAVWICRS